MVREIREHGVPGHVFHGTYHTHDDVKKAAERWEGPPPGG